MNLKDILLSEILPQAERPSRYLGNELNSVHKDPKTVDLRVCLFFPDLYELGLGNLGLHILYAILNDLEGVWAERGYSPAPDMEALLRKRGLPLFLYESKDPLTAADCIGFTLQSELTYTNVLNAIDLAGLPLRSAQRDDNAPLLFAGGPAAFNPEPMAPFLDFFVIGDGEEAIVEMAETLRALQGAPRRRQLEALAQLEGFYVPERYPVDYLPDGRVLPSTDAKKITKRVVRDLDKARFPTKYIVPFTQLVHDGIALEVLRGCTHGCRFCHAGMVTRPVRERSLEQIDQLMADSLAETGLENVSLVSLSTCDYSQASALVRQAADRAHPANVSVSLPSLRLDSFSVELAGRVADVRRSGLTFAPEAATPRLRAVINKPIPDEDLFETAAQAYRLGWTHVKTYFMIGLPTERDEDVLAIADLCIRTWHLGRKITHRAMVRTGVSTFVPKPFTPFQWCAQIGIEETLRRQNLLAEKFRPHRGIKFGRHTPETSFIEGLIARGDRRAAELIEAAWRNGAKLDTWDEQVRFPAWLKAIEDTGYDVAAQFRERDLEERLPWDHIDILVSKAWLQEEYKRALRLEATPDCRIGGCNRCGIMLHEPELCRRTLGVEPEQRPVEDVGKEPAPTPEAPPEPVQRLRFRIGRMGEARLLGHLDMQSAWIRALRRARAPLAYSQGFHAHPKIAFATAAPVGEESCGDYMDIVLTQHSDAQALLERIRAAIPPGFRVYEATEVPLRTPSLMSAATGFDYTLHTTGDPAQLGRAIADLLSQKSVLVERKGKARPKGKAKACRQKIALDIRPMIERLSLEQAQGNALTLLFTARQINGRLAKPKDIITLLNLDPAHTRVVKQATHLS